MKMQDRKSVDPLFWDERTWEVLLHPPNVLLDDNQIEVPQLLEMFGQYYLFFSVVMKNESFHCHQSKCSDINIYYMSANNLEGPFSKPKLLISRSSKHVCRVTLSESQGGWILSFKSSAIEVLPLSINEVDQLHVLPQTNLPTIPVRNHGQAGT